jgi:hypothetical protein
LEGDLVASLMRRHEVAAERLIGWLRVAILVISRRRRAKRASDELPSSATGDLAFASVRRALGTGGEGI